MLYRSLAALAICTGSLISGCDAAEPADAGVDAASTDAGPPPPDAGPQVGDLERFATVAGNTEGIAFGVNATGAPVLYVGVLGSDEIVTLNPEGGVTTFASLNQPLGIAARANGDLVVCARVGPATDAPGALFNVTLDGTVTELLSTDPDGAALQLPNYVAIAPDDSIVFSDSRANRLYRADADGSNIALITDAISYPNGLAFSADGSSLYVASWDRATIWALPFNRVDGAYGTPTEFSHGVAQVDGIVAMAGGALVLVTSASGVLRAEATGTPSVLVAQRALVLPANGSAGRGGYGTEWVYLSSLGSSEVWRVRLDEPGVELPIR